MKYIILHIFVFFLFISCTRDKEINPSPSFNCGTVNSADTFTHKNNFKLQLEGLISPDSVDFTSNTAFTIYGNHYFKRMQNPTLTLIDSTLIFIKKFGDINIIVYDSDTTKQFTAKIFKNSILETQQTGHANSSNKKFVITYIY